MGASDVCVIILAIFLPPIAVVIRRGCGVDLVINILLTLCGHIPGAIHAVYLVLHDRERRRRPAPYLEQTNQGAMHGQQQPQQPAYGNKQPVYGQETQQPTYGQQQAQPVNYEQPQPMPPSYSDYTERDIAGQGPARAEKHEYAPPAGAPPTHEKSGTSREV